MKDNVGDVIGEILMWLLSSAIIALLIGLIVMWLWNWLMPDLFALDKITYIQGWGLSALCSMLFKTRATANTTKE